ncbi:MAG: DUF116 domain-containing protein [Anaeromicrobium sp.]|jgi:hypothetical protein|uniref:DUF116 domain-containing protein n=1 Tax=Anaeromicrobium sp. TaxID=1929132 RepID=UPI0025FFBE49|nr:DUF116 domain-containing protein [Anaeromicrobium sp.]MCT4594901.1 DUF116 domain-containing protein [Anaeromicrobium sp.]
MKKNDSLFIKMIFLIMGIFFALGSLALYLINSSNLVLYKIILSIILIISFCLGIFILITAIVLIHVFKKKDIGNFEKVYLNKSIRYVYLGILNLANLLNIDKNKIRGVFAQINNRVVLSTRVKIEPEYILVLLPHCIQKSSCPHKVTTNIENCKKCGQCNIDNILKLKEKYNVNVFVSTGGTLARKIIKENNPKGIIAVACERDLSAGIMDVRKIPVVGVLNERPQGPCINTRVSVDKIEDSIRYLLGKE